MIQHQLPVIEDSKVAQKNSSWRDGKFDSSLVCSFRFNILSLMILMKCPYIKLLKSHPFPMTVGQVKLQFCIVRKSFNCLQCSIVCLLISEEDKIKTEQGAVSAPAHLLQHQHQVAKGEGAPQSGSFPQPLLSLHHSSGLEVEVAKIVLTVCIRRAEGECHQIFFLSFLSLLNKFPIIAKLKRDATAIVTCPADWSTMPKFIWAAANFGLTWNDEYILEKINPGQP